MSERIAQFFLAVALYVGIFRVFKPADLQRRGETVEPEENGAELSVWQVEGTR